MTATTIERSGLRTAGIDVLEAIRTRRSTGKVRQDPLPREVIEELLEAASWAPNHHVTQPWRFVVIGGEAREALGEVMGRSKVARLDPSAVDRDAEYERAKGKALRAPVIIAVVVEVADGSTAVEIEEIAAGAAATQNLLLAAHGLGLGANWRTGDPAYDPSVKAFLGFKPADHIIGFVYLGYPAVVPIRH
ncbi:MAG TPA: nitroreductase family protein [Thermomicrobiales bacterium]|nr:nitroreductase family protein [Thermomicrobiales bacterium]